MEIQIASSEAMYNRGNQLAEKGNYFLLNGELGAGKTTLAKGIAEKIGINPGNVTSPTYTYIQTHNEKLLHIDMRRIESVEYLHESGIIDLIESYPYVIIERPKRTPLYANDAWWDIHITKNELGRTLHVEKWSADNLK